MIRIDNHMGKIEISEAYFSNLIGQAASECFGVVGMAHRTPGQELRSVVMGPPPDQGVSVRYSNGALEIDLHICVTYGINIAAIIKSIMQKVAYTVETACGLRVARVNVYVADMVNG